MLKTNFPMKDLLRSGWAATALLSLQFCYCQASSLMKEHDTTATAKTDAQWIWTSPEDPHPKNRFTWFRKVIDLEELPADAHLLFAADSTARLMVNGTILRRKVARYHEPQITAERVNAGPYLRPGQNVVTVLHHNWGPITTFQRSANEHAGLYISGSWISTDDTWKWTTAPQFLQHESQIVGIAGNAPRIRYPVVVDARKDWPQDPAKADFDDSNWKAAVAVQDGPWGNSSPPPVETPGQREYHQPPYSVLAAGSLEARDPSTTDVYTIAEGIKQARCIPDPQLTTAASHMLAHQPLKLTGRAGESKYVTFDFAMPLHGYPALELESATSGTIIDFGYTEIAYSEYDGSLHVKPDGWINPVGVVGKGYADRYICRDGKQSVEFPDERTARWMALHVHFPADGEVAIASTGMVKSQFPIQRIGSFECGDPIIDQVVRLCVIHAEVTMSDAYIDTPGREDGQWIEDAQLRALVSERWFADTTLRQLMIRHMTESQGEDGQTHPFPPSNFPAYPAPYDWSIQWVGTLWDEYMWSGDANLVRRYWPALTRYWKNVLSKVNEEGLWQTPHVLADIRIGVRASQPHHSSGIVTPTIIQRLEQSATMADSLNEDGQAAEWREFAGRMKTAFRRYHIRTAQEGTPAHVPDIYDPQNPSGERGISQAGQTAALYLELLSPEEGRAAVDYAFPDPVGSPPAGVERWNNPTMSYRVLSALTHAGRTQRAVAHLKERYSPYLPAHPTNPVPSVLQGPFGGPLPEYWISRADRNLKPGEINTAQPDDLTGSHGWGAVPLYWLHEQLLGVRLAEPGGHKITVAPDAAGLPYVTGWTNTPAGAVHVHYDPQQLRLEVRVPEGCSAQIIPPREFDGRRTRAIVDGRQSTIDQQIEIDGGKTIVLECY